MILLLYIKKQLLAKKDAYTVITTQPSTLCSHVKIVLDFNETADCHCHLYNVSLFALMAQNTDRDNLLLWKGLNYNFMQLWYLIWQVCHFSQAPNQFLGFVEPFQVFAQINWSIWEIVKQSIVPGCRHRWEITGLSSAMTWMTAPAATVRVLIRHDDRGETKVCGAEYRGNTVEKFMTMILI